jgi:hypothetical protein
MKTETSPKRAMAPRIISAASAVAIAISGVLTLGAPAHANSEMTPVINFDGNTLANEPVAFEIGQRIEILQLPLETLPLTRVRTTSRPGYSFGGWSYQPGGVATQTLSSSSHTTTRVFLYAVWNTKINLNGNGATKGSPSTLDYRFAQDLGLPGAGSFKRKDYNFGGWMATATPGPILKSYRAGQSDNGNPTLYAAWTRTVSFKAAGGVGSVPATLTYTAGGNRLSLPTGSTLTRTGFDFVGWSTTPRGRTIKNTENFLPRVSNTVLHAVWKKN